MSKICIYGIIVQLSILTFAFANSGIAQSKSINEIQVSIDLRSPVKLDKLVRKIETLTDFSFSSIKEEFKASSYTITLDSEEYILGDLLSSIAKQTDLSFHRVNEYIQIRKKQRGIDRVIEVIDQHSISGRVTDENGDPLPGATVLEKGTSNGTITDVEGNFQLSTTQDGIILISFVGYQSVEIPVSGRNVIDVKLELDASQLEEVVVVGYGTQKKKDVTGSISSVSSERFEERPVTSVEQALQGLAPGLNIVQRNASSGELSAINIRGIGSLTAGYSPLWVIDGFPTDQRNAAALNPADIESIDILKDASSTAIYGSRGANGVIIITTKKAKEGRLGVNVDLNSGIAYVPESFRLDVLNAAEYVEFMTESYANRGATLPSEIANWDGVTDTDWQDLVYRPASFQNFGISASGGTEKASFLLSGNYIKRGGVVIGEGFEKYSTRLSLQARPTDRFEASLSVAPNYSIEEASGLEWPYGPTLPHALAAEMSPITPVRNPDGSYALGVNNMVSPLESAESYNRDIQRFRMIANAYVSYEIIEGLIIKTSIGSNLGFDKFDTFQKPTGLNRDNNDLISLEQGQYSSVGWLSETTINYKKVINDHSFDLLGGYTLQSDNNDGVSSYIRGFDILGPKILAFGNSETLQSSSVKSSSTLISYLSRLNYAYKDRYLLTATFRRDGSSRFGAESRFANFGSAAIGWKISEEAFFDDLTFIDDAKIRASIGRTGSNSIPDFIAKPSLSPVRHSFGTSQVSGVINADPGNINLTWETSDQMDVGIDLIMFDNGVNLTLDYYNNTTSGLLLNKQIPYSSGYPNGYLTNIGEMRNSGFELSTNIRVLNKNDLKWEVGGNVARNYNEVLDLGGAEQVQKWYGVLRHVPGMEYKQLYGVKALGVARQGDGSGVTPGDYIFLDADDDGLIGSFVDPDGVPLGSPNQDWIFGFNTNIQYRNFMLSALLHGQSGAVMQDFNLIQWQNGANHRNVSKEFHYEGRYIDESNPGDGETGRAGALVTSASGVGSVSSIGIQKTDYLRIKNIMLSYDMVSILNKYGLGEASVFVSVENLFTFTKFIGGNPDAVNGSIGPLGPSRLDGVYDGREIGVQVIASQPLPRIFTLGVNLSF